MAKQASRRSAARSVKTLRRATRRATSQIRPVVDEVQDEIGSALTLVGREGRNVYRAVEKRFGRTPTVSMLTVAGVGLAIGALLLGVAAGRQAENAPSGRGRRKAA